MALEENAGNGTEIDQAEEQYVPTSWEFPEEPPSTSTVIDKLKGIKRWGLDFSEYVEYVQPLGQSKNVSTDKKRKDYKTVFTLYVTVAGRLAMANDIADRGNWRIDFVPEPTTPTGIPGYLVWDDKHLVYREYAEIWKQVEDGSYVCIGRKPGTASVPATGGSGAVESSRFEKVETSARGRALGAWGIGVLPGSGVASYEEMKEAQRFQYQQPQQQNGQPRNKMVLSREELLEKMRLIVADYQDVTGMSWEDVWGKVGDYMAKSFSKTLTFTPDGAPSYDVLKDGELEMMARAIGKQAAGIRVQKESIG